MARETRDLAARAGGERRDGSLTLKVRLRRPCGMRRAVRQHTRDDGTARAQNSRDGWARAQTLSRNGRAAQHHVARSPALAHDWSFPHPDIGDSARSDRIDAGLRMLASRVTNVVCVVL